MLTEEQIQAIKPVRYERRVTDGQGLYLLVTPKGNLHWRFRYRFLCPLCGVSNPGIPKLSSDNRNCAR